MTICKSCSVKLSKVKCKGRERERISNGLRERAIEDQEDGRGEALYSAASTRGLVSLMGRSLGFTRTALLVCLAHHGSWRRCVEKAVLSAGRRTWDRRSAGRRARLEHCRGWMERQRRWTSERRRRCCGSSRTRWACAAGSLLWRCAGLVAAAADRECCLRRRSSSLLASACCCWRAADGES